MQKYIISIVTIATLLLVMVGCKSKKAVVEAEQPAGQVTLVLTPGATPESVVKTAPFEVLKKQVISKKNNEWLVLYDLKQYNRQDLTGYLINLANVVTLDGKGKDVTPPIRKQTKEEIPTKKQ